MRKEIGHLILLIILLFIDQFTKYLAIESLSYRNSVKIIEGFFYLTYAENSGAAWSILQGQYIFFIIMATVASIFLIGWYFKTERSLSQLGLIAMISGTLGNLTDRFIMAGKVRDFLDFYPFGYDFPVFNIADSCLCVGMALLLIDVMLEEQIWKRKN